MMHKDLCHWKKNVNFAAETKNYCHGKLDMQSGFQILISKASGGDYTKYEFSPYNKKVWHFIYKIPRRW